MVTASSLDVVDLKGFPGGAFGLGVGVHTSGVGGVYSAIKATVSEDQVHVRQCGAGETDACEPDVPNAFLLAKDPFWIP